MIKIKFIFPNFRNFCLKLYNLGMNLVYYIVNYLNW